MSTVFTSQSSSVLLLTKLCPAEFPSLSLGWVSYKLPNFWMMLLDDPCVRFCRIYESEIKSRREDKEEHMKPTGSSNRFWEQLATVHAIATQAK
jgi:hypothetical protein